MPFNNTLKILLISLVLSACSSIDYRAQGDSIEGYTDSSLGDDLFEITFQTYREGNHLSAIKGLALKRAVEISRSQNKPFFIVLSEEYETKLELVTIPEQKMLSFSGTSPSILIGATFQEIETIIPAHNKEFEIQRIILKIKLLLDYEDGAFTSAQLLN